METDKISYPLDYSRRIYERTLDWYKSAETKAQIVLTLNGLVIGFLGSNIFFNKELQNANFRLGTLELIIVVVMLTCLIGSIFCALMCLKSRFNRINIRDFAEIDTEGNIIRYDIRLLNFFDHLRKLEPEIVSKQMATIKQEDEIKIIAKGIKKLSENVKRKHRFVNISFVLFGISLIFFVISIGVFILKFYK